MWNYQFKTHAENVLQAKFAKYGRVKICESNALTNARIDFHFKEPAMAKIFLPLNPCSILLQEEQLGLGDNIEPILTEKKYLYALTAGRVEKNQIYKNDIKPIHVDMDCDVHINMYNNILAHTSARTNSICYKVGVTCTPPPKS